MITPRKKAVAGLALATMALPAPAALAAGAAKPKKLTAALAGRYAHDEALAAFGLMSGDKAVVTGCKAIRKGVYTCKVMLIPFQSNSRPHWTDTIRLVKGKPKIDYSKIING